MTDVERRVTFNGENHPTLEGSRPPLTKKSSLKSSAKKRSGGSVSFFETVTVRELPSEEADEAKETRKGQWDSAPEHDELWDGHNKDFWEEEKSLEEVRRIVVVRGMRMALEYNLGYAFYSMIANFKKRRQQLDEPTPETLPADDDIVPQYETPLAEETAIRKEVRELFADSVKGLDFPDLVQDREAFDKLYATTVVSISDAKRVTGLGLLRIEELVDEIMNTEEICRMLGVEFVPREHPAQGKAELAAQEKIISAVDQEEKRRGERRASIEAQNHGIPAYGDRRVSVEARRRASMEPIVQPQSLGTVGSGSGQQHPPARRPSMEPNASAAGDAQQQRRMSLQQHQMNPDLRRPSLEPSGGRRPSWQVAGQGEDRRPSIQQQNIASAPQPTVVVERRTSLNSVERRPSVEPRRASLTQQSANQNGEEDQPIFAASGRSAVRGKHVGLPSKVPSSPRSAQDEPAADIVRGPAVAVTFPRLLLGFFLLFALTIQRAFHVSSAGDGRPGARGGGPWVVIVPLLLVLLTSFAPVKSFVPFKF